MKLSEIETINKRKLGAQFFLIAFGAFLMYSLRGFINMVLGALVMYVLFKGVMHTLTLKWKFKPSLAAILIMLFSFAIVLVPMFFLLKVFFFRVSDIISTDNINNALALINQKGKDLIGIEIINPENIKAAQLRMTALLTDVVSQSLSVIGDIGIMYFILFYMLLNTGQIENVLTKYLPIDAENIATLGNELEQQTYSNVLGAPVLAALQGCIASLGFYFFGVHDYVFWGMMAGVFSIIPVIGSALIWVPIAINLYMQNMHWQAIALAVFGVAIISTIDNVFRFYFQKKVADVHPLITIVGLIMGLQLFGIAGTIFGPLLLSYFLILMKIYRQKYANETIG